MTCSRFLPEQKYTATCLWHRVLMVLYPGDFCYVFEDNVNPSMTLSSNKYLISLGRRSQSSPLPPTVPMRTPESHMFVGEAPRKFCRCSFPVSMGVDCNTMTYMRTNS